MLLRRILMILIVVVLVVFVVISRMQAAARRAAAPITRPPGGGFTLASSVFEYGQPIPKLYTADGRNISPPLGWVNAPEGTMTFALVCEDPDVPFNTFTHWLICEIPGTANSLPEAIPTGHEQRSVQDAAQGMNDFGEFGYSGPAPPAGKRHRYFFRLTALDEKLGMMGGFNKHQLRKAMAGHELGTAELIGTYERPKE
jgi:Raf kinase inhibitor-like YbhB/YbcL family protein